MISWHNLSGAKAQQSTKEDYAINEHGMDNSVAAAIVLVDVTNEVRLISVGSKIFSNIHYNSIYCIFFSIMVSCHSSK